MVDDLKKLRKSNTDRVLFGVCGGLAEWTDKPSWMWRLGLCVAVLVFGTGVLAYILLAIFMPRSSV